MKILDSRKIIIFIISSLLLNFNLPVANAKTTSANANTKLDQNILKLSDGMALACDPNDSRLKNKKLPKGVGPEAKVAAACIQLAWLNGKNQAKPSVKITLSPSFPKKYKSDIEKGILGGHRLFGYLTYPNTSYEAVFASDEAWMCDFGKNNVDTRSAGKGTQIQPWSSNRNSGCPGTPSAFAGWEPKILGNDGNVMFLWSFIKKKDLKEFTSRDSIAYSAAYYLRFISHEYVHGLQFQKTHANGFTGSNPLNPGPWYSEGQAQYIGFSVGGLIKKPNDHRPFALKELKKDLKKYKLKKVNLDNVNFSSNSDLAFSAGYFAYEYLLAHYGLQRTFDFYADWNSGNCNGDSRNCWRNYSQAQFGKSSEQLIQELNTYINAQI